MHLERPVPAPLVLSLFGLNIHLDKMIRLLLMNLKMPITKVTGVQKTNLELPLQILELMPLSIRS